MARSARRTAAYVRADRRVRAYALGRAVARALRALAARPRRDARGACRRRGVAAAARRRTGGAVAVAEPAPTRRPADACGRAGHSALRSRACGRAAARAGRAAARARQARSSAPTRWSSWAPTGDADDVAGAAACARKTSVDVRVPLGAAAGPVAVVDRDGAESAPAAAPLDASTPAPRPPRGAPSIDVDGARRRAPSTTPRSRRGSYVVHGGAPVDVARRARARARRRRRSRTGTPGAVPPETPQTRRPGTAPPAARSSGRALRLPRHAAAGAAASAQRQRAPARRRRPTRSSSLPRHRFPIRGPHTSAPAPPRSAAAAATRARTLRRLRHAAGGRARRHASSSRGYQSRAGNYLVIDGDGTGTDYAYMHLRDAGAGRTGRPRAHRPADRLRRRHRRRRRLPPALRDLDRAGLVHRRPPIDPLPIAARPGTRPRVLAPTRGVDRAAPPLGRAAPRR